MTDEVAVDNRQIVKGDCLTVTVTYTDDEGAVVPLTGYDAQLGVADQVGTNHWLGDKSASVTGAGAGTVSISVSDGVVTGTVPKTLTKLWTAQKKSARYQLAVVAPSGGCRTTLLTGYVEVLYGPLIAAGAT